MKGGNGIAIAVIAIAMADTAVTVPYVLPMDMATGITVLLVQSAHWIVKGAVGRAEIRREL